MKVFHINTCGNLSTGGIASDIIREVISNGGEGIFAYARLNGSDDIPHIRIGNKLDVYLHAFMSRVTDRTGFFSKSATRKLIKEIEQINPDLIHLHNLHGYYINIEELFEFLRLFGKPVVWTIHDCWSFTGHCAYFSEAGCERWKVRCHDCPLKGEYPKSSIMDMSSQNYKDKKRLFTSINNLTLVTPSAWLKSLVGQSFLNQYPCHVIYNGIDPNKFHPKSGNTFRKKYGIENKSIVLGVASVWSPRKGFNDFLELVHLVNDDVQLVMVGLTKKQIKTLPDTIIGIERTESVDELVQIYSEADLYFNASVEETMGLTTGEAIFCGTPVIVYDATAIPECVTEQNGIVVIPHDVKRVAELIDERVWEKFARPLPYDTNLRKEIAYKKYYSLYQSILD